ncbi:hypothetical protein ALNOE001_01260 [Candidatus Methanobinarius endosymbioticus]|uniref:Uncharacterized protein n=1 Tax=Candidatus Methanobinarius endosymbioticus TaxID=2006182 RepID=A0A366MG40_9EURY|nr:hypothetical protein ALNOE001_01260 [Candidatus Methanobinarius endosymbioticus]
MKNVEKRANKYINNIFLLFFIFSFLAVSADDYVIDNSTGISTRITNTEDGAH